jgi:WD40 repeat protein
MRLTWILACTALALCACPRTPVNINTDPSILRGAWVGTISRPCQTNIADLAWSPDGTLIATAGTELALWNATDGTRVRTIAALSADERYELHWSADGKRLAVLRLTYPGLRVQVFNPSNGAIISTRDFGLNFRSVTLSDDLETLIGVINASASGQVTPQTSPPPPPLQTVRLVLWNLNTGLEKRSIALGAVLVNDLVVNADASRFAVGVNNAIIKIFDGTDTPRELVIEPNDVILKLLWNPAGTRLSALLISKLRTWNAADGAIVRDLDIGTAYGYAPTISPDEKRFAIARDPNTLELWNLETSAKVSSTTLTNPYVGSLSALRFNPTSSQLGFVEQNVCDLRLLNASDGSSLRNIAVDQAESKTITLELQAQFKDEYSYTISGTASVQGEPAYTVQGKGYVGYNQILVQAVPYQPQSAQIGLRDATGKVIWGQEPTTADLYYGSNGLFYSGAAYQGSWQTANGKRFEVKLQHKP